ncbi:MAG: PilT/PilU family type 4a pilus ATPase [Candidatus Eisenbacteria sp.]|nr:PilT/PilU family type 4a pilus ATPase [Candidatus Eisenbacteria bacterium]
MEFRKILEDMMEQGASDLHMKAGTRPVIRVDGSLQLTSFPAPTQKDLEQIVEQILTPAQREEFTRTREIDFGFGITGLARFRSNFYYQRGSIAIAIRHVPLGVPAFEDLNLPSTLKDLAIMPRGLVLVTGTVGSGKSTTLASMIDLINRTEAKNIITIEDPIEFLHRDEKSVISQREVGLDTESYLAALKHILRQDPDVLLLGEIRDRETMSVALMAADTGHLVMSTLHTADATQTINRIVSFYPPHQHDEVRFLLASNLAAVISMRLIVRADGKGRVPAVEVMINTETIRDYILDPTKTVLINAAIAEGVAQYGMQSFDQSMMGLFKSNLISLDEAIRNATNPTEFELRIKGIQATSDATWDSFEGQAVEEDSGGSAANVPLDPNSSDVKLVDPDKPWERFEHG